MFTRRMMACLLVLCLASLQGAEDKVVQQIKGTETTPGLNGANKVAQWGRWTYVLIADWNYKEGCFMQFEKTDEGRLKFAKVAGALPGHPMGFFFGQFEIRALPSGKAMAYLFGKGYLCRYDIDESSGAFTKRDHFEGLGAHMFFSPDSRFVYFTAAAQTPMTGFAIDPTSGAMTKLSNLAKGAAGPSPNNGFITSDGLFAYTCGSEGMSHQNKYYIACHPRNPQTGELLACTGVTTGMGKGWDWGGMGISNTPRNKHVIAYGGSSSQWVFLTRNEKDGMLTQDSIFEFPASSINVGESMNDLAFYDDHTGYFTCGNHHGGQIASFEWDPATGGRGVNDISKFHVIYSQNHEILWNVSFDRPRQMLVSSLFNHIANDDGSIDEKKLAANELIVIKLGRPAQQDTPAPAK